MNKLVLIIIVISLYCKKTEDHSHHEHHHHEAMAMGKVSDKSIYNLQSKWKDTSGQQITLNNFKGKNVIIAMIYGSCVDVCPILVDDMKNIEKKLGDKSNSIQFVIASFDPVKDSPESFKAYREKAGLTKENWAFLSGANPDEIQELAAVLGVKYKKEENGLYTHSNIITLLNTEGEIIYSLEGLKKDSSELVKLVN